VVVPSSIKREQDCFFSVAYAKWEKLGPIPTAGANLPKETKGL
jgi:hypothetical protein